jgi:hypothetical protein
MDVKDKLKNMANEYNYVDNTDNLRLFKNSKLIKKDTLRLIELKEKYSDEDELKLESMVECSYLANNYTDIYNRIRKDEIDLAIFWKAIDILENIENGLVDNTEGSYQFGLLLKEIYIDSALKKSKKLDEKYGNSEYKKSNLSWSNYKKSIYK